VSDTANTPFPQEEICAQAQANAAAWILTMIAYSKERGLAVEDCVAYHGRRFAPAWEELRGRPVEEVAQLVALNALSVGWWTFVSTTIASTLSFLPRVTFNERANSTARSLSAASVSEPIWLAQRMRVVSSGAASRYNRQNWRKTIESLTKRSVCS
jgi:hypothetical protein